MPVPAREGTQTALQLCSISSLPRQGFRFEFISCAFEGPAVQEPLRNEIGVEKCCSRGRAERAIAIEQLENDPGYGLGLHTLFMSKQRSRRSALSASLA